eukprot:gene811-1071_t
METINKNLVHRGERVPSLHASCSMLMPRSPISPSLPAIAQCNTAGIKVFTLTSDHPTAHAIAKSLNIITKPTAAELKFDGLPVPEGYCEAIVVHGTEMQTSNEADWTRELKYKQAVHRQELNKLRLETERFDNDCVFEMGISA